MILYPDIINIVATYLNLAEFYKIKDIFNLSVRFYCKNLNQIINIYIASSCGYLDVVKYLYSIGQKCTSMSLEHAYGQKNFDMIKYLYSVNVKPSPHCIDILCRNGNLHDIKYLHS